MYLSLYNNFPVYGYIYKIIFPNGKCYIGLTVDLDGRWKTHNSVAKSGPSKQKFYNALRKYNMVDTFIMIIIDTAETKNELEEKEIAHIEIHKSHYIIGNGYNMTYGGEGCQGYEFTELDRQKMSESQTKRYENPEARRNARKIKLEYYKNNPGAGRKISEGKKKKYREDPNAIKKNREALLDYYKNNPNAIKKNREAQLNYYRNNPNAIKKNREAQLQRYKNKPESKKKKCNYKPFDVFKDGTFIASFDYQFEAIKYLQENYDIKTQIKISEVLRGKRKSSAGFTFKYKE